MTTAPAPVGAPTRLQQLIAKGSWASASDKAAAMELAAPLAPPAEPVVRFCPGCGSIGPVPDKYRDCCPDGIRARMVPAKFAKQCRGTFQIAIRNITSDAAPLASAPEPTEAHSDGMPCLCNDCRETAKAALAAPEQPPEGWRKVIVDMRLGLAAGGRSISGNDFEIEYGGALLDHLEEKLAALATAHPVAPTEEKPDLIARARKHIPNAPEWRDDKGE